MLNADQSKELAAQARSLTGEEREEAIAYAHAALSALRSGQTASSLLGDAVSPTQSSTRTLPPPDFFEAVEKPLQITKDEIRDMEQLLHDTINSFVPAEARHEYTRLGPCIIRFGILPTGVPIMVNNAPKRDTAGRVVYAKRTKIEQITNREKDIQAALGAKTIRMLPPVPGEHHVGVEIPNPHPMLVSLRDVLASNEYQSARAASKLVFALGQDVAGHVHVCDIAKAPHLLVAGATGAGKSMLLNTLLASLLTQATPDDVRLLMIDPKVVELNIYNGIPHLLRPVVVDMQQVVPLLDNAIAEMERRYQLFSQVGVRNLEGYRKVRQERIAHGDTSHGNLPAIVIIIDELADLMMTAPEDVEAKICRLAQKARATGIHLVIATQRPSVDVITGLIKANIPTRIAFMVASWQDSKTILDATGAEKLLGRGDMLYLASDAAEPERIQGAFMTDQDAINLASYWREAQPTATSHETWADPPPQEGETDQQLEHNEEEVNRDTSANEDDDGDEALMARIAAEELPGRATISIAFLQRTYRIGYPRAARIIDELEQRGLVGPPEGGRNIRKVLVSQSNPAPLEEGEPEERLTDEAGV